jgi:hypothetical protein
MCAAAKVSEPPPTRGARRGSGLTAPTALIRGAGGLGIFHGLLHDDIERDDEAENECKEVSRSGNLAPAAGRRASKRAENSANVIIKPANVYKKVSALPAMFCFI